MFEIINTFLKLKKFKLINSGLFDINLNYIYQKPLYYYIFNTYFVFLSRINLDDIIKNYYEKLILYSYKFIYVVKSIYYMPVELIENKYYINYEYYTYNINLYEYNINLNNMFYQYDKEMAYKYYKYQILYNKYKKILSKNYRKFIKFFINIYLCVCPRKLNTLHTRYPEQNKNNNFKFNFKIDKLNFLQELELNCIFMQLNNITTGDKLSGRHGNKGVISKITHQSDLPYSLGGLTPDLIISPLTVPSRMNLSQLYEGLLGFIAEQSGKRFIINTLNTLYNDKNINISLLNSLNIYKSYQNNSYALNKYSYIQGHTGLSFTNSSLFLCSYFIKLMHMSLHKIHYRSQGQYYATTQQPTHSKSLEGGQRFGEMELWALEAFSGSYNIYELLTLKSDSISSRETIMETYLNKRKFPVIVAPESVNLLKAELYSIGLNLTIN